MRMFKKFILAFALANMLALYTLFIYIFFRAYFNPPFYDWGITINTYGEMYLEAILFLTSVPCVIYLFKYIKKKVREEDNSEAISTMTLR